MTGSGKISIGTLLYDDLILNNVQSNVALDHGVIRMDPVTSGLAQGQQSGSIVIDARSTPTTYAYNMMADKIYPNQLISSVSNSQKTLYRLLPPNSNTNFSPR